MLENYTDIKAVIVTKLEALQIGLSAAFIKVYTVNPTKPTGYPVAAVLESEGEGEPIDTARNERVIEFRIKLIQEMGKKTPAESSVIRLSITDAVFKLFDQDPQLKTNGDTNVITTNVSPISFDEIIKDRTIFESEILLQCKILVNNYS